MKKRWVIAPLVSLLCAVAINPCSAQTRGARRPNVTGPPGCYELKIGPWTPPLGAAAQYAAPPDTVQLFADSNFVRPEPGWKRASPAIRHDYSRGRERAMWTEVDPTSFRIVWSNGFSGADMRLFRGHPAYFGLVRAFTDVVSPEGAIPKATVVAKSIECRS